MAYLFRTSGPWGPGTSVDLTPAQVDGNFWQAIQDIAAKAPAGVGIANFVISGNQLTVVLTDHTLMGPYTLPMMSIQFQGEWQPHTYYAAGTILTHGGATWFVNVNHTSAATFDPGANDGHGTDIYGLLLENPGISLPTGGAVGDYLRKSGAADYVTAWFPPPALADLTDVQILPSPPLAGGDVLAWDQTIGLWVPKQATLLVPPIPETLESLSDVVITSPAVNDTLSWDGTEWINKSGGGGGTLAGLSDVYFPYGLADGEVLTYSSSYGKWINKPSTAGPPLASVQYSSSGSNVTIDPTQGSVHFIYGVTADFTINLSSTYGIDGQILTIIIRGQVNNPRTVTFQNPPFKMLGGLSQFKIGGDNSDLSSITFAAVGGSSAYYYEIARNPPRKRINTAVSSTYLDTSLFDVFEITGASSANTWNTYEVMPGQEIAIMFQSAGTTSYNQTFGTPFKSTGPLATGTVSGKTFWVRFLADMANYWEISRAGPM